MIEKEVWFKNNNNMKLSGVLHIPDGKGPFPAVIITHGFKRDKKQTIPQVLAQNMCSEGFVTLRFDFQNCGDSEGKFEDLTLSQQVEDIYSALDYLEKDERADKQRIGIAGVSMGGGVSLIAASRDKRIKSLVAFAPRLRFRNTITKRFSEKDIAEWRKKGIIEFHDPKYDKNWKLKSTFLESCMKTDVTPYADKIKILSLLIQGEEDKTVPFEYNKEFFSKIKAKTEVFSIKNCDHQFRQVDALHSAVKKATEWFNETLH